MACSAKISASQQLIPRANCAAEKAERELNGIEEKRCAGTGNHFENIWADLYFSAQQSFVSASSGMPRLGRSSLILRIPQSSAGISSSNNPVDSVMVATPLALARLTCSVRHF